MKSKNDNNMKNSLGLEKAKMEKIAADLNILLANYQSHYQNLRGVHWNIKGKRFFDLHVKFEELYNSAQLRVDEIAERVLTLGQTPLHTFADYQKNSSLTIGKNISDDEEAVKLIIKNISELLTIERPLLPLTDEANDEGTNNLVSGLIAEQEKNLWMLKAYLDEMM